MRILLIDNFDSFTYNLVDAFRQLGAEVEVYRNTVAPEALDGVNFDLMVLSPGPSIPENAGNLMEIIRHFYQYKPMLGVCLGHQALVTFLGGSLKNIAPVHGKSDTILHDGRGVFTGLEPEVSLARYHSWAADSLPPELEVSARSADGEVMAIRHKKLPIAGIQFHPESVLSMRGEAGMRILKNVLTDRLSAGNRTFHSMAKTLQSELPLTVEALSSFLRDVEEGQLSENQKQILLVSLSHRLRKPDALFTFIQALMPFASQLDALPESAVDICGTGGSGLPRINTSTLASLLLSAAGLRIAKHGNRAAAGRFGSFNLLEKLGVPAEYDAGKARQLLETCQLAFLFAPGIHPIFRHFASMRSEIGVPTAFNVLGPLVNPLQPRRQFIGTAFADMMELIFETGIRMGKSQLIVARGHEGLDEISISGPTRILEYRNGVRMEYEVCPEDFGIQRLPFSAVSTANAAESLKVAETILDGETQTQHHKLVLINAAFIYSKFVEPLTFPDAYKKMEAMFLEAAGRKQLQQYIQDINQSETKETRSQLRELVSA
jgi:anthranilate synthase/phosphoribosyltransferase